MSRKPLSKLRALKACIKFVDSAEPLVENTRRLSPDSRSHAARRKGIGSAAGMLWAFAATTDVPLMNPYLNGVKIQAAEP